MSQSRRPSISIYNYPEHLNPFNDDITNSQPEVYREEKPKDSKHKFWTFGRSRKKRSNSFSIKSTWSGLFGKRKDPPEPQEKRSTITTVSTTYKRDPYIKPEVPAQSIRNQQEFHEALSTLARRRKYTSESSSTHGSSLMVNGDPARIYDGSPKSTTTSIIGDLTPKPPARRFGQVSPKPTDKIPALDYEDRGPRENGTVTLRDKTDKTQERTPVPPLRRFGNRSSQRTIVSNLDPEEEANRSGDVALCDENENVPDDYVFKRCNQDAIRKSNLSINSCVSIGSTTSGYRRKKRRAPQPPGRIEQLETPEEKVGQTAPKVSNIELQIVEPLDIARVTENIDEMTKKNRELDEVKNEEEEKLPIDEAKKPQEAEREDSPKKVEENCLRNVETVEESTSQEKQAEEKSEEIPVDNKDAETKDLKEERQANVIEVEVEEIIKKDVIKVEDEEVIEKEDNIKVEVEEPVKKEEKDIHIEYRRTSQDNLEIIKDVDQVNSISELDEVCLRKKNSSETLSRSNSFSVKDEIEKIEKQIKALETRNASRDSSNDSSLGELYTDTRRSIQANRRHFFQDMVDDENSKSAIKIEIKELPREQKDIHVVRLTDPPVPVVAPRDPVKVIELHISEPIKQKPEILDDVNPIPKPRRHSALNLNGSQSNVVSQMERKSLESTRGKSF